MIIIIEEKKKPLRSGELNPPVSRVTGGDTHHYTTLDVYDNPTNIFTS